jgi:glycosyltransferase involved in cell wall biosynthesis
VPPALSPALSTVAGAADTDSRVIDITSVRHGGAHRVIDLEGRKGVDRPRVVIAHDYVTQRGGAERVVLGLLQAFPGSRLVTSVYDPEATFPEFADHDVETLWPSHFRLFRRDPRRAFPFLARAWARHVIADADVVICSSSGWAHGVSTTAPKIVYCHNPARWLYQPDDYLNGAMPAARIARAALAAPLIRWDTRHAGEAARYVVNSTIVAQRVLDTYGRDSQVIPPPVMLDVTAPQEPVEGLEPGFLLSVARARGYKNVELVCEAVQGLPSHRLVVLGDLPDRADGSAWSERLQGVGRVSDAQLRWLYANCAAVVTASHEDFGLTPLEGNLFGKPAVVLQAGGFLDTLVDGMNGCFITEESVEGVRDALQRIPRVNPVAVRTYATGFRQAVFARRMHEVVDEVLGGPVTAPADQLLLPVDDDGWALAEPA